MVTELGDAFRSIVRAPRFSLTAIALLAVTIGMTSGVSAIVDAVMLRPMSMVEQNRTVVIWQSDPARDTPVVEVALGEIEAWRRQATTFDALGVFGSVNWTLTILDGDVRLRVPYTAVSASFFRVLDAKPALGRLFDATDEAGSGPRTAVVSDQFWKQHLSADPRIVGRTIRIQGDESSPTAALEIVGVMPPAFDFPSGAMLWLPAEPSIRSAARGTPADQDFALSNLRVFYALGRLRRDVTAEAAQDELTTVLRRSPDVASSSATPPNAVVTQIDDFLLGPAKPVLWTMLGGAALMMLLACANVAALQLFRAAQDDQALAIQLALGASRGRLVRRSLFESIFLAVAAATAAVLVGWAVSRILVQAAPLNVPRLSLSSMTASMVLITMVILTTMASVLTGLWPALFIGQIDPSRTLVCGGRTAMQPRQRMLQRLVVGSQVAIAVVILSGAALFVRSVQRLDRTVLGFNPRHLLSIEIEPSFDDAIRRDQFYDALLSQVKQRAGVTTAGAVYLRPLNGPIGNDTIPLLRGQALSDASWRSNARANLESVTPGYFQALGTRIVAGRDFTPNDRADAPSVVIVSASAARRYWPDRDPIGEPILVPTQRLPGTLDQPRWQRVVGVVDDIRYRGIRDPRLDLYLPAAQSTVEVKHLLVRTDAADASLATNVRAMAQVLDPAVHIGEIVRMDDVVANQTAPWRFAMRVLSGFGIVAAVLASVGLTGLVSLVVALRQRELGIRAALGATPARLRRHVAAEGLLAIAIGAVIGILVTLALGRLLGALLVDTPPSDLISLTGAAALTFVTGLLGCALPAYRAAGREPADVLRG